MEIFLSFLFALLGASIGSFLNVLIDRLPKGESAIYPPSHCASCHHPLAPRDIVPIISFLWLRARCRYCGARIPVRMLLVELSAGVAFFLAFWQYGLSIEFVLTALLSGLFIVIMAIDAERQLILNRVIYPAALAVIAVYGIDFLLPQGHFFPGLPYLPEVRIFSSLLGGAAGFIFFLIVFLIARGGMGAGDVKLAGLIGLVTGFPLVFLSLFIGIIAGGVAAIVFLLLKLKGRKDVLPYGVFLGLGPIITLLYGDAIMNWYRALFNF